jgi:hypothetical protein
MFDQQGALVAGANVSLLALWTASALAALLGWRMMWLHVATTALFVVAGVLSSYFLGESVIWLTGLMALGWVGAAIYRYR